MGFSPFQLHVNKFKDGCGSDQCAGAIKCFARGSIPCDVLFVGQAPGQSENVLGRPFCGPAGQIFDQIVVIARAHLTFIRVAEAVFAGLQTGGNVGESRPWTYAVTNLVMCMPLDDDHKEAEPYPEQIRCCGDRLREMVEIANPGLIVTCGTMARDWLDTKAHHNLGIRLYREIPQVAIIHPSAILKVPVANRGMMMHRAAAIIEQGIREYLCLSI